MIKTDDATFHLRITVKFLSPRFPLFNITISRLRRHSWLSRQKMGRFFLFDFARQEHSPRARHSLWARQHYFRRRKGLLVISDSGIVDDGTAGMKSIFLHGRLANRRQFLTGKLEQPEQLLTLAVPRRVTVVSPAARCEMCIRRPLISTANFQLFALRAGRGAGNASPEVSRFVSPCRIATV